jgi:hypothetical protein
MIKRSLCLLFVFTVPLLVPIEFTGPGEIAAMAP